MMNREITKQYNSWVCCFGGFLVEEPSLFFYYSSDKQTTIPASGWVVLVEWCAFRKAYAKNWCDF